MSQKCQFRPIRIDILRNILKNIGVCSHGQIYCSVDGNKEITCPSLDSVFLEILALDRKKLYFFPKFQ